MFNGLSCISHKLSSLTEAQLIIAVTQ